MADRPSGFPRTTRLDTGQERGGRGAAPAATPPDLEINAASDSGMELRLSDDIGKKIAGRYEITEIIGEGGMGVVYEAWDRQVERKVAIKLVRSDTTDRKFLSRFRRELEVTSKLRHPSTIRVFEHGETRDGRPYMVMELLTGESLADRLEQGALDEMEAMQITRQVAESLSEAHEHGIFHRDLKPDNIFIETVGVSKVVKVLDFGIAGGVDATRLTQAGEVFGTPQYMSPEQCNGLPLDHRTDIYSLACILYEMLEGKPPFSAETPMATMLKHVRGKVPPARNASKEAARVFLMGLRKDRSKRIQTAGRFSELIGQCIGHLRAVKEGRIDQTTGPTPMPGGHSGPLSAVHTPITTLPKIPGHAAGGPGIAEDRTGRTIAIALGLAAIGLVMAMVFGDLGGMAPAPAADANSDRAKSAHENDPPVAPKKKLPKTRALVQSKVPGAQVSLDGLYVCDTPCTITVPVGDRIAHEIRLQKDGYIDVVQLWKPKSVGELIPQLAPMEKL